MAVHTYTRECHRHKDSKIHLGLMYSEHWIPHLCQVSYVKYPIHECKLRAYLSGVGVLLAK